MSARVWLLALATFVTGLAENITVGILPALAEGLQTPGCRGSVDHGLFPDLCGGRALAPQLTSRWELRRLLCTALLFFTACNLAAALANSYALLLAARIGMAAASALTCLIATLMATRLVSPQHRGRAIGVIFMGISGSLVLGVPTGMLVCEWLGWRGVFLGLAVLACTVLLLARTGLPRFHGSERLAALAYLRHLRDGRLSGAQAVSILMIGGHFTLFAYLAPYAQQVVQIPSIWLAPVFAAFGIAGVSGGYLGGWAADVLGPRRAIVAVPLLYLASLLALPWCMDSPLSFVPAMMVWGCASWMISPVVQSYLAASGRDGRGWHEPQPIGHAPGRGTGHGARWLGHCRRLAGSTALVRSLAGSSCAGCAAWSVRRPARSAMAAG